MRRLPRLCVLALLTGVWSQQAWATPTASSAPARAVARAGSPKEVAELAERAGGASDPLSAIDTLAALQGAEVTRALAELLESGLPDASTDRILERLVEKPRPELRDPLEAMARHRRPGARVLALRAIAAAGMADQKLALSASTLLAAALRDSDARVRGTAASALGQRFERNDRETAKNKQAYEGVVDVLLQAVAHGVPEAPRAAGLAVSEATLPRLHEALRGLPLTATLDAYDAALARRTLSEAAKLDVLARLGEIATPATKTFLQTLIAKGRFPLGSRLQRALVETEKQIVPPPAASGGKP